MAGAIRHPELPLNFLDAAPPIPSGDALLMYWHADGVTVTFAPHTADPVTFARRLRHLLAALMEWPSAVEMAAGIRPSEEPPA